MNSTKPITSADPEFAQVLRNAAGLGLCVLALVIAGLSMQRAGERMALLDAVALMEEAASLTAPSDRERLLARSAEALTIQTARNRADPAAPAALARVRLLQSSLPGADQPALLADADRHAALSLARGAGQAELSALRAEIALAVGDLAAFDQAPALIMQSYTARPADARLALWRARIGLRLWGDLDEPTRTAVRAEACIVLREAPGLTAGLEAAALAAEAPLLPSEFAEWKADSGCQPQG